MRQGRTRQKRPKPDIVQLGRRPKADYTIISLSTSLYVFFAFVWFLPGPLITLTLLSLLWPRNSTLPGQRHHALLTPAEQKTG